MRRSSIAGIIVGVAVAMILLWWIAHDSAASIPRSLPGEWIPIAVLGGIALLIWLLPRFGGVGALAGPFLDATAIVLAFAFLEVALWRSGWLPGMFRDEGLWHLAIYPLGLLALAIADSRQGMVKKAALYMTLAGFAIFGFSHTSWGWLSGWSSTPPVVADYSACDGQRRTYTLTSSLSLANGGARCRLVEWGRDAAVVVAGSGVEMTFPAGAGGNFSFDATGWRCASASSCHVAAYFCPSKYDWDSVSKKCQPPRKA